MKGKKNDLALVCTPNSTGEPLDLDPLEAFTNLGVDNFHGSRRQQQQEQKTGGGPSVRKQAQPP